MSYKTDKVVSILKKNLLMYILLWLITTIVFVAPVAYSAANSMINGTLVISLFLENFIPALTEFTTITKMFRPEYIEMFKICSGLFSVVYVIAIGMGVSKAIPNSKYSNIEHGSSDWCENGEQYKILSRNKGIILAKEHYLPIDKRGNTNVLIVGRIGYR